MVKSKFFLAVKFSKLIEYYRVDIWGFFKRPELEMVK